MAIDHLVFGKQKYFPDAQIISNYVDLTLIGRSITYKKYRVGWLHVPGGYVPLNNFNDDAISWTKPSRIDNNVASIGKVNGISLAENRTPYYTVWFDHTVDHGSGDGLYRMLIKASDIMKQKMSGNSL